MKSTNHTRTFSPRTPVPALRHALRSLAVGLVALAAGLTAAPAPVAAQTATCLKEPCPRQDVEARRGTYGAVQLSRSGRELPLHLAGVSGGPADAPELDAEAGGPCGGFTGVLPDHVLVFHRDVEAMRLEVASRGATSLVVHGPEGWICSDGGGTRDRPALEGTFVAGTWRVWVASAEMGAYHDYTLSFGAPPEVVPAPRPGTRPRPGYRPPREDAVPPMFVVRGRFEELDVYFEGASVAEVHAACADFVGEARSLGLVDDVVLHGRAWRNVTGFWSAEALCAMVALNARPEGAEAEDARARGHLEGVPFEVHGGVEELREVLRTWLPVAVNMTWADDLEVNGQTRRNRTGYWTLEEVIMLVVSLSGT